MVENKPRYIQRNLLYIDKNDKGTKALRNPLNGQLMGRRAVRKKEKDDGLRPRRVKKGKYGGQIIGLGYPAVRGSRNKRATVRRRLD